MTRVRGTIARLARKKGFGFITGEDGVKVYFEESALKGIDMHSMWVGENVEYDIQFGARSQAINITPIPVSRRSG